MKTKSDKEQLEGRILTEEEYGKYLDLLDSEQPQHNNSFLSYKRWYSLVVIVLLISVIVALIILIGNFYFMKVNMYSCYIDTFCKVFTLGVILFGGILSYYKFFKGRTFLEKLHIHFYFKVLALSETENYHSIEVEVENIGSIVVKNIEPVIYAVLLKENKEKSFIAKLPLKSFVKGETSVIDPLEVESFHFCTSIPLDIKVIRYYINVKDRKFSWSRTFSAPNTVGYECHNT